MTNWFRVTVCAVVSACATVSGCSSSKHHGSAAGGIAGAAGDASGEPAGAPGDSPAGGEGGANAASDVPIEAIGGLDCEFAMIEVDDSKVYYGCRHPANEYSTQEAYTLHSLGIDDALSTLLATSEHPLRWLASDGDWHYVREYFDDELQGGHIRRLQEGSNELLSFIDQGGDGPPDILLQTDDVVVVAQGFFDAGNGSATTIEVYDKFDGTKKVELATHMDGAVRLAWLSEDKVFWIAQPLRTPPTVYAAKLSGSSPTKIGELPELCDGFVHLDEDTLVAFCGPEHDLVRLNLQGETTLLVSAAATNQTGGLYVRDRVYWTVGGYTASLASSLHVLESSGQEASVDLLGHLSHLTTSHAYLTSSEGGLVQITRFALQHVK